MRPEDDELEYENRNQLIDSEEEDEKYYWADFVDQKRADEEEAALRYENSFEKAVDDWSWDLVVKPEDGWDY